MGSRRKVVGNSLEISGIRRGWTVAVLSQGRQGLRAKDYGLFSIESRLHHIVHQVQDARDGRRRREYEFELMFRLSQCGG